MQRLVPRESGFIMMPPAIPQPATTPVPGLTPTPVPGSTPPLPPPGAPPQTVVEVSSSADRNQLFAVWDAVANLADLAGKVSVTLKAESEKGFDRSKLQNGVIEPLREADLIE